MEFYVNGQRSVISEIYLKQISENKGVLFLFLDYFR